MVGLVHCSTNNLVQLKTNNNNNLNILRGIYEKNNKVTNDVKVLKSLFNI